MYRHRQSAVPQRPQAQASRFVGAKSSRPALSPETQHQFRDPQSARLLRLPLMFLRLRERRARQRLAWRSQRRPLIQQRQAHSALDHRSQIRFWQTHPPITRCRWSRQAGPRPQHLSDPARIHLARMSLPHRAQRLGLQILAPSRAGLSAGHLDEQSAHRR